MNNSTCLKNVFFKTLLLFICCYSAQAQVFGTSGTDRSVAISNSINTYYPVGGNITLNTRAQSIVLRAVPSATGGSIGVGESGSLTATSTCSINTVPKNAGEGATVVSGGLIWSNPNYIVTTGYAMVSVENSSVKSPLTNTLQGTNYGFAIPENAIIKGIQVAVNRFSSISETENHVIDNTVQLIKAGTVTVENKAKADNWSTGDSAGATYGGTTDLWGVSWTAAEINDPKFGVALMASIDRKNEKVTAYVNYMRITVTYTVAAPAAPTASAQTFCSVEAKKAIRYNVKTNTIIRYV